MSTELLESNELGVTPHLWISQFLKSQSDAKRRKVREELISVHGFEDVEAETLVSSAADIDQVLRAINNPIKLNVGKHVFSYIELDVVTWRILPSPENVRFEDQRLGLKDVVRFGALHGTSRPVLTLNVASTADLISKLGLEAEQIRNENPHTKTIPSRGIENAGWLSLTRVIADDAGMPFGVLDATDGFSRTVGAHDGLQITAREVLTKFTNHFDESDFRKKLLKLKKDDQSEARISESDATKLRSSVMRRARIIVGYSFEGASVTPTFDKARRTLVGHLHLAPQHAFSAAAKSATKASAIADSLFNDAQIPTVSDMTQEQLFEALGGNIESWLRAGYKRDQFAVFVLSAFRPKLSTRQGRAIKGAIEDLTGQSVKSDELAEIAADISLRPVILEKGFQEVGREQLTTKLRSILSKTWQNSLFQGVNFTGRPLEEITDEAITELETSIRNGASNVSNESRAELAAMASFTMVALTERPILDRAVGRAGHGNNDEPSRVMAELINRKEGILQLSQIILDVRNGNKPRILDEGETPAIRNDEDVVNATQDLIKEIYLDKAPYEGELPATADEVKNALLHKLSGHIEMLRSLVEQLENLEDESGMSLVTQRGLSVDDAIRQLNLIVQEKLSVWNGMAKMHAESQRSRARDEKDLG
jgi:hypothetical protein